MIGTRGNLFCLFVFVVVGLLYSFGESILDGSLYSLFYVCLCF